MAFHYPGFDAVANKTALPQCEGPKLEPFTFQGQDDIKFVGRIGDGRDAVVFEVTIDERPYALKVVSQSCC